MEKKWILRFEKGKAHVNKTNEELHHDFSSMFHGLFPKEVSIQTSFSSTNQVYGTIAGVDYLIFDAPKESEYHGLFQDLFALREKMNDILKGKSQITAIHPLSVLRRPQINRFSYYVADLSGIASSCIPENVSFGSDLSAFAERALLLQNREPDENGENFAVYDLIFRANGNRKIPMEKKYVLLDAVPHLTMIPDEKKLYFISDGNLPVYYVLSALLHGTNKFYETPLPKIPVSRLDYVDSTQKIQHVTRYYENVLGDPISLDPLF